MQRIDAAVGQEVEAGDVLAQLDATDYRLQVREAEAGVAQAEAAVSQARVGLELRQALADDRGALLGVQGHAVGREDLEGRDERRLTQGVGVLAHEQGAVDSIAFPEFGNRLSDGQDVMLVEARLRRASPVTGRPKGDLLGRIGAYLVATDVPVPATLTTTISDQAAAALPVMDPGRPTLLINLGTGAFVLRLAELDVLRAVLLLKVDGDWTPEIGRAMAEADEIELDDVKWDQIMKAREYYEDENVVPPIRKFAKYIGQDQKEIFKMWKTGPMKPITKYGGLPKPTGCV